jgi:hypothetical protein
MQIFEGRHLYRSQQHMDKDLAMPRSVCCGVVSCGAGRLGLGRSQPGSIDGLLGGGNECWWRRWCGRRRRQRGGRGPDGIARAGMQPREASGRAIQAEVALPSRACRGHDLPRLPQPPPHVPSTTGRRHRTPSASPRTHARPGRAATRSTGRTTG